MVTNHETTCILRRCMENMLEGSEKILLHCTEEHMQFQIVDAMWICVVSLVIDSDGFNVFHLASSGSASIQTDLRPLHQFLKRNMNAKQIAFMKTEHWSVNALSVHNRIMDTMQLPVCEDETPYVNLTSKDFRHWIHFAMDPQEFANITLDLAVGGGHMDLTIFGNNVVSFRTKFQTGEIAFHGLNRIHREEKTSCKRKRAPHTPGTSLLRIRRRTRRRPQWVHGRYIIKFLKLICGVTPLCEDMLIYLQHQGPLILRLRFSNSISMTVSVIPK